MHHIYCNERTLSRHLHYGLFTAKRGDMKRSCTVRERKPKSGDYAHKVEKGCYQGRDFRTGEAFRREHPSPPVVYTDLVIGRPGGQRLLTLHWKDTGFMVAILIPNKCADNVVAVFDRLYEKLGHETDAPSPAPRRKAQCGVRLAAFKERAPRTTPCGL